MNTSAASSSGWGRLVGVKGPGIIFLWPIVDRMVKVSLRTVVMDVPPQDIITKDNVSVKVNAVVYFRVVAAGQSRRRGRELPVCHVAAFPDDAAEHPRPVVAGRASCRDGTRSTAELQKIMDLHTEPWGIKISNVEVKQIDLPSEMQRAMARQAEAERERRAKVIHAEGEFQASQKLADAAQMIEAHPMALQLRYLQTLTEVASEKNSTTIFPVPIDLIAPFLEAYRNKKK